MTDIARYASPRTMVDWSKVQPLDDCTFAILPTSVWRTMEKLFQERGYWRTTYYVSRETNYYIMPTEIEFKAWIEETEQLIMACTGADLIAELTGIRDAILASNQIAAGCCAGAAEFVSDGEGGYYYGTEPPTDVPGTFGGPGEFADLAAFNTHRCLFANNIVSGLVITINNMSILTSVSVFAGTLVVSWFVASPPVAVLLALLLAEFTQESFENLAQYIADHREDYVCGIVAADGVGQILAFMDEQLLVALTALGLEAWYDQFLELQRSMLTTDVLNDGYEVVGLPAVDDFFDCANCLSDCSPYVVNGDLTQDINGFVVSSEDTGNPAEEVIDIRFGEGGEPGVDCGRMGIPVIDSGTLTPIGPEPIQQPYYYVWTLVNDAQVPSGYLLSNAEFTAWAEANTELIYRVAMAYSTTPITISMVYTD